MLHIEISACRWRECGEVALYRANDHPVCGEHVREYKAMFPDVQVRRVRVNLPPPWGRRGTPWGIAEWAAKREARGRKIREIVRHIDEARARRQYA